MKGRRVLVTFIAACATVCVMTPSVADNTITTISVTLAPRARILVNSSCPGL